MNAVGPNVFTRKRCANTSCHGQLYQKSARLSTQDGRVFYAHFRQGSGVGTTNARGGVVVTPLAFHTCCSRVATQLQRLAALRPIGLPGCRLLGARGGPAGAGCSSAAADRHLHGSTAKIGSQAISEPYRSSKDAVACYCVLASIAFVRTNAKLGG